MCNTVVIVFAKTRNSCRTWKYDDTQVLLWSWHQMEKYAHRRNDILGIIKAHYNILKTRPSNVNCWNINAIAMGDLYKGAIIADLWFFSFLHNYPFKVWWILKFLEFLCWNWDLCQSGLMSNPGICYFGYL